ncbi:MAG TPA: 23S rRNA (uracil(1939)-C(5))-methyltransferase RlmD [Aeromonadales bacterium]|nr:23S rRNA (uracil(1939)-C(5))-methyltransferase RlmD [Aeromonadales bacterium]
MSRRRRKKIPQEPVELFIDDLAHDGRGVAKSNGKTVFVTAALPGETVSAQLINRRSKFDEAKTLSVSVSAEDRVEAQCPHFDICGGCSLQHLQWKAQIKFKAGLLKQQLQHFGEIKPQQWLEPLQANAWAYRRKARLGVKHVIKKGGVLVGFREKQSHFIADIKTCHILHEKAEKLLLPLRDIIGKMDAKARLPQIEVAIGEDCSALVFRHLDPMTEHDRTLLINFANQHAFDLYFQPKGPDTVHKVWPENGRERLYYSLPEFNLKMAFHPMDFTQVNLEINQLMTSRAIDLLELSTEDRVLDLFCGLGNFSLPMATKAAEVVAVEGSEAMVSRGYENATANGLNNIQFHAADLTSDLSRKPWANQQFDKILIDPPRSGAQEICHYLKKFNAKKIVYVSCNPATLARDAGILKANGYRMTHAGVMDMFPHTGHVESLAVFVPVKK